MAWEELYQDSLDCVWVILMKPMIVRKFLALGAGFKFSTINVDLSYLFSTAKNFQSPLKVPRFLLSFNFEKALI